jgi:hypothetical protein
VKRKSIKTLLIISLLLISTSLVACQGSRASNEEAAPEVESTSPALAPVATSESVSDALVEMAKEELAQSLGVPIEQIRLDSVTSLDVDADT